VKNLLYLLVLETQITKNYVNKLSFKRRWLESFKITNVVAVRLQFVVVTFIPTTFCPFTSTM